MKKVIGDLLSLTKPRLSSMVVITAGCGTLLAKSTQIGSDFGWWKAFLTITGTTCVVGAANAINCLLESDVDAQMVRTRNRPLVQGRLSPATALIFGLSLLVFSMILLLIGSNPLTAFLGLLGFLTYIGVYTPLKRRSMIALFAGAVPGAIPPMMGWTAVTGHVELGAWILFGILFFWQLPHFIAISIYRQDEYENAGLKTVPGTLGLNAAGQHMLIYSTLLVGVSLLPYPLGLAGTGYFLTSLALGILFSGLSLAGILKIKDLDWSRAVFFGSLAYLPLVLGAWVLEKLSH